MLQKITLHNLKSHQLTELDLDDSRLHALVGQNSSGKTSVLQALHYISRLGESKFQDIFKNEKYSLFHSNEVRDLFLSKPQRAGIHTPFLLQSSENCYILNL